MADTELFSVRFKRSCVPYNAGEVAGFTFERAQRLVLGGAARYVDAPLAYDSFGKPRLPEPALKRKGGKVYIVGDREVTGKADAWALWSQVTGLPLPEGVE